MGTTHIAHLHKPYTFGTVAQSSGVTPTSGASGSLAGSFLYSEKWRFDEYLGLIGAENDTMVARAQANAFNARAENLRGNELRSQELQEYQIADIIARTQNTSLKNDILRLDKELKEYTLPNDMALSDLELQQAETVIDRQIANILLTEASIEEKRESVKLLQVQRNHLYLQSELAKANINLTLAQVEETYQRIQTLSAEELVALSQNSINLEMAKKVKSETAYIDAQTAEVPANARVSRSRQRFQSVNEGINTVVRIGSAIFTGGASEVLSSGTVIQQPTKKDVNDSILLDSFGKSIRK